MTNAESPQQTATLAIDQAFQQAVACQQAGQFQDAERLYCAILKIDPNHPNVNHNLGVLAVQTKQPAAGLPHFMAALDADPTRGQFWLSYIDALIQSGQLEDARQVLALAQQQGLQGDEVEALSVRLEGGAQVAEQSNAEYQHDLKELLPVSSTAQQNSKKKLKAKPTKQDKSAGKSATHKKKNPTPQEINELVALFSQGRFSDAATIAQAMTVRFPMHEFGWKALGAVFNQMGRSADALVPMQKAAALSQGDVEVHYNLGVTLQALGRLDEAEASYRRALQINPDYAQAHCNLGAILQSLGRMDEAEASYRRALQISPDYAKAHSNLGAALQDLGRLDEAEASYRRALQIKPDNAEAHYNLGVVLQDLGRLDEAEASYRRALQIKPDNAEAHNNLGSILLDLGRLDEAEASYRRALQIKPDYIEAHSNLGSVLLDLGHADDAEASYRQALKIKPDFVEGRFNLVQVKKVKAGDENLSALVEIEEAARNGAAPLSNKEAVFLHFALGKCYDDLGDYNKAFPHFLEGCKLKRAIFDYNQNNIAQYFASIIRVFDRKTIDRLHGGGDPSYLPIFVLGMPRSGTTLTEQIISSHPEVHGAGELPDLLAIAQRDIGGGATFPDNLPLLDQTQLTAWGAEYVTRLQRHAPNARHITVKMTTNFFAVGLIHLMLPNARIIHVKRNPVDTCLSCLTALFKHKHAYTYDMAELGRYYVDYTRLMEHWRKILPSGAFLDVQYEDIVTDQEVQSRRIIEYCGLEWSDACLDFHKNKRPISTASMTQVRQPIYKSSIERWRHYEKFLGPLLDALGELAHDR